MADQGTITWPGESGQKYRYWIYDIDTTFNPAPANYIFARKTETGAFAPIYIGQTGDISERFDNHHKMPCIKQHGATHIHVHKSDDDEKIRMAEESDLIAKWNPPCND